MDRSPEIEQLAVAWRLVQLHVSAAVSDEALLAD
jgi:hypothetical protein